MSNIQFWRTDGFSDESLLDLITRTFGVTFTNVTDARAWLKNNGYFTTYPDVVTDGLVLSLDAQNLSSYKGEPTTNIAYSYNSALNTPRSWINSGAWISDMNSTDIEKPSISNLDISGLGIMRGEVTTSGSIHFGYTTIPISPSTTYTMSVWFRHNIARSNTPYMRGIVNNVNLGYFSYNGSTSSINWPINEWIIITCTQTTPADETYIFLSKYIQTLGDTIWYFGFQIEQKDHATHLSLGTRGSTVATGGGWEDLSGNSNNGTTASDVTYSSDGGGSLFFTNNGTSLAPSVPISVNNLPASTNFTLSAWVRSNDITIAQNIISRNSPFFMRIVGSKVRFNLLTSGDSWLFKAGTTTLLSDTWYYLVMTYDGSNFIGYINADEEFNVDKVGTVTGTAALYIAYTSAGGEQAGFNGNIATIQIHNKTLTPTEVLQNFDSQKIRFGL